MFLATTAIDDFWNKEEKLMMLGEWCLLYERKNEWQTLNYEVMPYPWNDREKMEKAYYYCNDVSHRILSYLCEIMNSIHSLNYSHKYWQVVLAPWLFYYIRCIFERYTCLKEALDRNGDLSTIVLEPSCYYTPINSSDSVLRRTEDFGNLQIYSQILNSLGYDFPKKMLNMRGNNSFIDNKSNNVNVLAYLYEKSLFFRKLLNKRARVLIYSGVPLKVLLKLMLKSHFRVLPLRIYKKISIFSAVRRDIREKLTNLQSMSEFERCLIETLPVNFPKSFVEDFSSYNNIIKEMDYKNPLVIVSGQWFYDEAFSILAAEQKEKGGVLIGIQHGGGYGYCRIMDNEDMELEIVDKFYSWGWGNNKTTMQVKPMPSLVALRAKANKYQKAKKEGILLVITDWPRYMFRICSQPVGPQFLSYMEWCRRFLFSLGKDYRSLITIRPYSIDYGYRHLEQLLKLFPEINLGDSQKSFEDSFKNHRLTVIDHNSTTFLETLASNYPTELFWNPDLFEIRPEAEPYFNNLRSVGILHDSPEKAARHLERVYDHLDDWWRNADLQQRRQEFVNRFALCPHDGQKQWMDELLILKNMI